MRDFGKGGFKRDFGPQEMHKATCAECGNECEVPFKPSGDRPVYCKECYMKRRKY
jgi:CxxC-x17-CxxC domain-containing protein